MNGANFSFTGDGTDLPIGVIDWHNKGKLSKAPFDLNLMTNEYGDWINFDQLASKPKTARVVLDSLCISLKK